MWLLAKSVRHMELKVGSRSTAIPRYQKVFSTTARGYSDGKEYQIDQWRPHGKAIVAKLLDIDSRDDAECIKNLDISIDAEQLPELGDDGVYWRELNGMQVVTTQGYQLGVVKEVFNTGANDVIRVRAKANDAFGQKERLLPFVFDSVVQTVDKTERVITVEWDPGF